MADFNDFLTGEKDETDFIRKLHILALATFEAEKSEFRDLHTDLQNLIKPEIDTVCSFYQTKIS